MQITPQPATVRENLAGPVERGTFHNDNNGFCADVGHAAAIGAGEPVQASGRWVNDRTHGVQFRADSLRAAPPTTAAGIEKCLAPGMIKGIGPICALHERSDEEVTIVARIRWFERSDRS
jgi:exodeoxyribonuclease V alpha subunit